ncbi:hypothetical protein EFA69_01775 [Rufibacter immobilis]|uniref:DUF6970 domain-containing protein n=1 Tax=Rufibacter immobilis TaxID=1348778 RepID=A0A3M9N5V4_9BACT|nr:hypothetical protein [Rufibacter immobilis]RNI33172.1 hypothetical protein EFA69_01775 [Rufibacter immobilis]
MRYLYALCFFCFFALSGCEEEVLYKACVVSEPTQNIEWLRRRVQELQKSEYCQAVQTGNLNGRTVFVLRNCDPAVNSIDAVYDCDGNLLCYAGDDTCPNFSKEVRELRVIWTNGK